MKVSQCILELMQTSSERDVLFLVEEREMERIFLYTWRRNATASLDTFDFFITRHV